MKHAILVSHGTDDHTGAANIRALVDAVQQQLPDTAIHEAFVDVQHPQLPEVLARVIAADPSGDFTVIPLLLSTGFHVRKDITDAVTEALPLLDGGSLKVTQALGPSLMVIDLLYQRVREAGWLPDDILVLAVAGSSDEAAVEQCRLVHLILQESIHETHPSARIELAFLSAVEPKLKDLIPKLKFQNPRRKVLVANYLLAPGFFNNLANKAGAHSVAQPLLAEGQPIASQMVQIVLQRLVEANQPDGTLGCTKPADTDWICAAGCAVRCR